MSKKQIISIFLCTMMVYTLIPLTACRKRGKDMNNSSEASTSGIVSEDTAEITSENSLISSDSSTSIESTVESKRIDDKQVSNVSMYENIPVAVNKKIDSLPAEDSVLLNSNPERGFRLEIAYDVQYLCTSSNPEEEVQKVLDVALKKASSEKITIAQVYLYLSGYRDRDISKKGLNFIQTAFDVYRKNHISMLLRFAYQTDLGRGGATTEYIYKHIRQLAPVVQKNKDVIYAYQAGIVGAWGEWHSESPSVDRPGVMNAIVNNLISDDIYLMVRLPNYKNYVSESNSRYNRIGFHNDCFFGKRETSSLGGGGIDPGSAQWDQTVKQSPFTPNDAELYWNDDLTNRKIFVDGLLAVQMMEEHHFTSLSVLHSYVDAKGSERTSMGDWKKTPITKDWLSKNGILYSDSWFTSKNGNSVNRNAFEYIRDYMGYRIEAQSINVTGDSKPGSKISIKMPIVNYGTGAAFNMKSGFVILNSNNQVVTSVEAGTPEKWYSTDPNNYSNRSLLTHNINAQLQLPSEHGKYKLAFYMKNKFDCYARIANNISFENGFNILHTFAY